MSKKQFMDAMSKLRSSKKGPILEKDYSGTKIGIMSLPNKNSLRNTGGLEEWNVSVGYNDLFLPGKEDHDETASPTAASGSSDEERRIETVNGRAYTKQEFFAYYKNYNKWNTASAATTLNAHDKWLERRRGEKKSDNVSHIQKTPPTSMLRQGSADGGEYNNAITARYCLKGDTRVLEKDFPTYIIAAHGHWNKGIWINQNKSWWKGMHFGVLVPEGNTLHVRKNESRQQGTLRHIQGIKDGQIKVFRRYPFLTKNSNEEITNRGIFPNLIFGEGGEKNDSFVATIVRVYKGKTHHFYLKISVDNNVLIPFCNECPGFYPAEFTKEQDQKGNRYTNHVTLSQILPLLQQDIIKKGKKKMNIIFASCLGGIPNKTNFHDLWLGRKKKRVVLGGGGKIPFSKKGKKNKTKTKRSRRTNKRTRRGEEKQKKSRKR